MNHRLIKTVFFLLAPGICGEALAQRLSDTALEDGPYRAGFKVINTFGPSRPSLASARGREMQLCIWYPAGSAGKKTLLYRDYLALQLPETNINPHKPR